MSTLSSRPDAGLLSAARAISRSRSNWPDSRGGRLDRGRRSGAGPSDRLRRRAPEAHSRRSGDRDRPPDRDRRGLDRLASCPPWPASLRAGRPVSKVTFTSGRATLRRSRSAGFPRVHLYKGSGDLDSYYGHAANALGMGVKEPPGPRRLRTSIPTPRIGRSRPRYVGEVRAFLRSRRFRLWRKRRSTGPRSVSIR